MLSLMNLFNDNLNFSLGGDPGSPGLSLLLKADGRIINLGGKASVNMKPGVSYSV